MNKRIFFVFVIVCIATNCLAQKKLSVLTFSKIDELKDYISFNYEIQPEILDTLCLYTTVFMKFNVSKQGQIVNLGFTKSTPIFIKDALKKAIESSNGHWKFTKKEAHLHTTDFILPVVLFYGMGCKESGGILRMSTDIALEKKNKTHLKLNNTLLKSNYAVLDILNFDNNRKHVDNLKCVLLSSISFSANKD